MRSKHTLGIVSDIHYACAAEQARGADYEAAGIHNPFLRTFVRLYRHFFWLREPLKKGYLLDRFLERAKGLVLWRSLCLSVLAGHGCERHGTNNVPE